ncbi:hypothetical protein Gohar_022427 [Gossypium harknessii]|uniref:Uncharacterized protein n=1 Tax=Gossypium harknessii TaxID=34285 RepID=A0A7J9I766_9ROSI|nr:hypothetical protein [Gossypium harknessii]
MIFPWMRRMSRLHNHNRKTYGLLALN